MSDRRRTTIRLPVPTGPDRSHFAYSQMRWLYQATCEAMGGQSSATRQAIQAQAFDALHVLLPEEFQAGLWCLDTIAMTP